MTTFRWLNKQGVESTDGFVLQSMHRFYYHYIEFDRALKIFVEPCRTSSGGYYEEVLIASNPIWEAPNEALPLSAVERSRIQDNVAAALQFMGIQHKFVGLGAGAKA